MSTDLTPGSRVLVTGITGFIGAHVGDQFLKAGYTVIGTSRKASRAQKLKDYFTEKYGAGKFEVAEVGDLEDAGAFDDLVKDVEVIAHVASPVFPDTDDPVRDIIQKAINGTLSVLRSAATHGANVKHVIVTSSVASVINSANHVEYVHSEKDWNEQAIIAVKRSVESGQPVPHFIAYGASKAEAEKAIWKFKDEKKPHFKISTILPSVVFGALLPAPTAVSEIQLSTSKFAFGYYTGENQDPTFSFGSGNWVAVTDVAQAHVKAAEAGAASDGQRYILNNGPFSFQEVIDILRKEYPERRQIIVEGTPGKYSPATKTVDGSKANKDLGIVYQDLETTLIQTIDSIKSLYPN
ncbi:methylglyoxal reductase (NADPH-dependent) gre2 [Umbelopsis nana]